jgi:16S rRNA (adenine1518-N6/adenine1519-N6)-dimethyltransferase
MTRQRLGQHFLADPGWRDEIARAIRVSSQSLAPSAPAPNICWIEIGPGHGEMTEHLAVTGAPVYAVEIDAQLAHSLQTVRRRFPNVSVLQADILKTRIDELAAGRRVRIYGNLPYYITSPILHHLFASADLIDEIHLVVQLEVAARLAAGPGTHDYAYLSVLTQYFTRPELVMKIPRGAFSPPPEVDSELITLRLPGERVKLRSHDEARFLEFVKLSFAHKRKTLVNNLKSVAKADEIRHALRAIAVRPDARAEQLSVTTLAELHEKLPVSSVFGDRH